MASKKFRPEFPDENEFKERVSASWLSEDEKKKVKAEFYMAETLALFQVSQILEVDFSRPLPLLELAMKLARKAYPPSKRRGRPQKWSTVNASALVFDVEELVDPQDQNKGVGWACEVLSKREPWCGILSDRTGGNLLPDPAEALRKVYYQFKDDPGTTKLREIFRRLRMSETQPDDLADTFISIVRNSKPS